MKRGTFSEHWHRVATQRVGLRPTVQTRKQFYRGEKWFLVLDPLNNHFFRITPNAHEFVCRLDRKHTVQEVWEQCLERDPDGAPGQEEVIHLLSQLHQANLLRGDLPPDSAKLLERQRKRRRTEIRALLNPIMMRIPLFDPDPLLQRLLPFLRWLFGPVGIVLWVTVIGAALKLALDHASELSRQTDAVLAPGNLPFLYAGMVLIKVLHELGHAITCRYFGGEVHQMGVMLMYFSPVPYVDATSSWAFRSKWQRILVASAGMITELFVAALAVFVWVSTGSGALHSLAYNMIFVASVTTLLFNANPLLRYDGYYILSDLLEIPNLQTRSMQMLKYLAEHYVFDCRGSESPAHSRSEGLFLALYGVLSWIYRILLFVGIALWVSDQFLLVGILMALACVYSFTVKPVWQLIHYLASSPTLVRTRHRAVAITAGGFAILVAILAWVPAPSRFRAPGVVQAEQYSEIFTQTPGTIREILAASGSTVAKGAQLIRLSNRELELQMAAAQAELSRASAEEQRALENNAALLAPTRSRRLLAEKRVRRIHEQQQALVVTAPHAGTWVAPEIKTSIGQWFPRGQLLGHLIQDSEFRFTAVISQDEATNLFSGTMQRAYVRLRGQAGMPIEVKSMHRIPAQQEVLPSAALGWAAGGEIATSMQDPSGVRAAEPFFELRASLQLPKEVALVHGRSGKIRIDLESEPLLNQWYRKLRQLLQRKYQL